jgi:hypothetical protein
MVLVYANFDEQETANEDVAEKVGLVLRITAQLSRLLAHEPTIVDRED